MDYKDIQRLVKLINREQLAEFKMRDADFEISIRTINYSKSPKTQIISSTESIVPAGSDELMTPQQQTSEPMVQKEAAAGDTEQNQDLIEIKSPIVGTFYRSASPEKPPYIKVGDQVDQGQVVCIIEAMKLFNEIESEISGKIVKVLVEDAQPVQYDQALFLVDPKG